MLLQSLDLQFYLNSQEKTTKPNLLGKLLFVRLTVESQIYDDTSGSLFGPLHDVFVFIAYAQNAEKNAHVKGRLLDQTVALLLFVGAHPDQTPQNAASDQGLHCLLT